MDNEFILSLAEPAITSGRGANCFFQSFIHTLSHQSPATLNSIEEKYPSSTKAFVHTFNTLLELKSPVDFKEILKISQQLHPLERECIFGPILRHTYNLIFEDKLKHDPDAILYPDQSQKFANAFGAELNVFLSKEQFELSEHEMPATDAIRIKNNSIKVNDRYFYHDLSPQLLANGELFKLNIVYADKHLNYTLGTRALNNEHNRQVITQRTKSKDGAFAVGAVEKDSAPLAKGGLTFSSIAIELCRRFNLISEKGNSLSNMNLFKKGKPSVDDADVYFRSGREHKKKSSQHKSQSTKDDFDIPNKPKRS